MVATNIQAFSGDVVISSNVGIGTTNPRAMLDINDTGALIVPGGTTAQRPSNPVNGMLRYNSETGLFETYSATGWDSFVAPPVIGSFTPTIVETTSTTTVLTVSGGFFDQYSSIKVRGTDGTEYSTTNFNFTSTVSISATLPSLPTTNNPYTVLVTSDSGLTTESTGTLISNNTPVWSSPAAGTTFSSTDTITLVATDADGDTLSYSIVSGSLPSGVSLSGNQISGTSSEAGGTTNTFGVRASDGFLYVDRSFSMITPLYAFTTHTFTNASKTGPTGPTLTECRNAYSPSWVDNSSYFNMTTQGFQKWTVPVTATYEIEVGGARGGNSGVSSATKGYGGNGGWTKGQMSLTINTVLVLIVGQAGTDNPDSVDYGAGGGGGASWVLSENLSTAHAVAGGGGGSNAPRYATVVYGGNGGSSQGSASDTAGGTVWSGVYGSGGAGFGGNGASGSSNGTATSGGGRSPANGALGGTISTGYAVYDPSGGFGGGGSTGYHGGGGGGGYAGGDATEYTANGPGALGGTTRNNMSSTTFSTHSGTHGYIKITRL